MFHELATNATKYGALATELGTVRITVSANADTVTLNWREVGGPSVTKPTTPAGFGTQLIEMSAVRQLGGSVNRTWNDDGLIVDLTIPKAAFSR
jgi:two-component sensor histidine kinase